MLFVKCCSVLDLRFDDIFWETCCSLNVVKCCSVLDFRFDDVFRETGVLLLTGNPFLPDVEGKDGKASPEAKQPTPKR